MQEKDYTMTLPSDTEIKVVRVFNTTPEMMWKITTDPTLIPQWWGPRGYKTMIDKLELRVGGKWRYVQINDTNEEFAFNGEFKTVEQPNKLVYTFEWEGMPGHVIVDTVTFEAQGDKTLYTAHSQYANKEDRDGMMQMGMEDGMSDGFARTDELIATLK